jgi:deoxycytidine triphosphate deaminase
MPAAGFAPNDDEAATRYEKFKRLDPFPEIPPSLLNSADISDYVRVTGMLHPFDAADIKKPASYSVRFSGECRYWSPEGAEHVEHVGPGDQFTLRKNHIAFVTLEPRFRIPEYIALRFNLQIKYIHQGILVGTGPLVDPGYDGQLFLPLHNLTANDYQLEVDDGLVWMEFTKISASELWNARVRRDLMDGRPGADDGQSEERTGAFVPFPKIKLEIRSMRKYLGRAHPGPIQSSIPMEIEAAKTAAESANAEAKRLADRATRWSVIAGVTVIIAALGIFIAVLQLVLSAKTAVDNSQQEVRQAQIAVADANVRIASLERRLTQLERQMAQVRPAGP